MKIIADCNDGSFLVQMRRSEIENLTGLGYRDASIKVGSTLKAGENAELVRRFRQERGRMLVRAEDLRALATLMESSLADLMPEPDEASDAEVAA